jgi:hypothetical protein
MKLRYLVFIYIAVSLSACDSSTRRPSSSDGGFTDKAAGGTGDSNGGSSYPGGGSASAGGASSGVSGNGAMDGDVAIAGAGGLGRVGADASISGSENDASPASDTGSNTSPACERANCNPRVSRCDESSGVAVCVCVDGYQASGDQCQEHDADTIPRSRKLRYIIRSTRYAVNS